MKSCFFNSSIHSNTVTIHGKTMQKSKYLLTDLPKLTENPNKNVYVNTIDRIVSLLISVTCLIIKVKVNSKRLKRQADIPNINKGRLPFRSIINMDANEPIRIVTPVPRFA